MASEVPDNGRYKLRHPHVVHKPLPKPKSKPNPKAQPKAEASTNDPKPIYQPVLDADGNIQAPTFTTPKAALDGLPLETLLQVASYLDLPSALRLSRANRSFYQSLAGSQYFWFKWGNQGVKSFQQWNPEFDYRGYMLKVGRGFYRTTCQLCFTPRIGEIRHLIRTKPTLCQECMEGNLISMESVKKIPNIDASTIKPINMVPQLRYTWPRNRAIFAWFPDVRKAVEEAYNDTWKQVVTTHLQDIRPLASLLDTKLYRAKAYKEVIAMMTTLCQQFSDEIFKGFFSEDHLKTQLTSIITYPYSPNVVQAELSTFWAPAPGQFPEPQNDPHLTAMRIMHRICGSNNDTHTPAIDQMHDNLRGAVYNRHVDRLLASGKRDGRCEFCFEQKGRDEGAVYQTFLGREYVMHVYRSHKAEYLTEGWLLV